MDMYNLKTKLKTLLESNKAPTTTRFLCLLSPCTSPSPLSPPYLSLLIKKNESGFFSLTWPETRKKKQNHYLESSYLERVQYFLQAKMHIMPRKSDLPIFFVTQIPKLLSEVHPVLVEVEWVPIVVGALFQKIGTPVVSSQNGWKHT